MKDNKTEQALVKEHNTDIISQISDARVGIDKLVLGEFDVLTKDFEFLLQLDNAKYYSEMNIQRYEIYDGDYFDILKIFLRDNNVTRYITARLELSVRNNEYSNLVTKSYEGYSSYLECVLDYIEQKYQIRLISTHAKIRKIELNTNIILQNPYEEYRRVLVLMMNLLPKTFKESFRANKHDHDMLSAETFYCGNKSIQLVLYNKTKALENKGIQVPVNRDILRVEYKLLTTEKIQKLFGSAEWNNISQEEIERVFYTLFSSHLINKIEKWKDDRKRQIKAILKNKIVGTKSINQVLLVFMNEECIYGFPQILDAEQVLEVVKEIKHTSKNYSRTYCTVMTHLNTIPQNILCNKDLDKLEEIVTGVCNACNCSGVLPQKVRKNEKENYAEKTKHIA